MHSFLKSGGPLLAAAGLAAVVAATPAFAQDAGSIQSIQRQIQQLQQQLKNLQAQSIARDAELKKAQVDAETARAQAAAAQAAATAASAPTAAPFATPSAFVKRGACDGKYTANDPAKASGTICLGNVSVTLGGYFDLTGIYRTRNENAGLTTSFTGIPFPQSPNNHTGELRASSQATRVSGLIQGSPYDGALLSGYLETDLNSAGSSSNSTQSNSYTLRLRQAYVQLDDSNLHLHMLAGQAFSFATAFTSGLTPRKENVPGTLDSAYNPGFVYTRQPQIRFSTDYDNMAFLGLSIEAPQTTFGGTVPTLATGNSLLTTSVGYTGTSPAATAGTVAGGGLNPVTTYSYNTVPDFILKAALEPGFGHFEVYGLLRFFKDEKVFVGGGHDYSKSGGGVGGSFFLPVIPGYLEVSGNVLAGYGVGRYGTSGLPDATYTSTGSPRPLPEVEAMLGVTGHPTPQIDLYSYLGTEQAKAKYGAIGTANYGYGNPAFSNAGCNIELSTATCTANTSGVTGVTVGGWYKILKGGYGTLQTGVSYEYDTRNTFRGTGGAPSVSEQTVMVSMRYLPFQ